MGFAELVVIFIVALLVFGPDKIPEVVLQAVKFWRGIQRNIEDVTRQIDKEIQHVHNKKVSLDRFAETERRVNESTENKDKDRE